MFKSCAEVAPASSVYGAVLGRAAEGLDTEVAVLHCGKDSITAAGRFDIKGGSGLAARCLARILRLPGSAADAPVTLAIERDHHGEHWCRDFGTRTGVDSHQHAAGPGALVERFGILHLFFAVWVANGALRMRCRSATIRLGRFALGLPAALAPRIDATARASASHGVHVGVHVSLPAVGLLLAYEGTVRLKPARPHAKTLTAQGSP